MNRKNQIFQTSLGCEKESFDIFKTIFKNAANDKTYIKKNLSKYSSVFIEVVKNAISLNVTIEVKKNEILIGTWKRIFLIDELERHG
jgi:ribosomal protein S3